MHYTDSLFEAYAKVMPRGTADEKNVYIVGSGMAALSAACFLVRDAHVPGSRIHILEKEALAGGACDGYTFEGTGPVLRGDHRMEEQDMCLWDLLRSVPSADDPACTVLDECYQLSRLDPNYSLCRQTERRGEQARTGGSVRLTDSASRELLRFLFMPDEELAGKQIGDVLSEEILASQLWFDFRTLYGFQKEHGASELKRRLKSCLRSLKGMADMSAFLYPRYHFYDSVVMPVQQYLEKAGVQFHYGVSVTDVAFDCARGRKKVTRIDTIDSGEYDCIDLTEKDYVLITLGSCVENSTRGSADEAAFFHTELQKGGGFDLWRRIAEQDPSFGHPEVFCLRPEETNRMSATILLRDGAVLPYIKKICRRDPFSGKTVTGGIVSVKDSAWMLSWTVARQPLFRDQEKEQCIVWLEGLVTDAPGNYIMKPMRECTGTEICEEWLWHLGVPEDRIAELAAGHASCVQVMMPYVSSPLLPSEPGDRPDVVPEGSVNFAFLGQFAETECDAAGSVEYAVRTGMEAAYTLFDIERGVPEAAAAAMDLRQLAEAFSALRDGHSIRNPDLKRTQKAAVRAMLKHIRGTDAEKILKENRLL